MFKGIFEGRIPLPLLLNELYSIASNEVLHCLGDIILVEFECFSLSFKSWL